MKSVRKIKLTYCTFIEDILQIGLNMFEKIPKRISRLLMIITTCLLLASCSIAILEKEYPDSSVAYAPTKPENVKLNVNYEKKTMTLSWDKSAGASIYHIYYTKEADFSENGFSKIASNNTYKTFSFGTDGDLDSDTMYVFYVTASTAGSKGSESPKSSYLAAATLTDFEPTIMVDSDYTLNITFSYCNLDSALDTTTAVPKPYFNILIKDKDGNTISVVEEGTVFNSQESLTSDSEYTIEIEMRLLSGSDVNTDSDPVVTRKVRTLTTPQSYRPQAIEKEKIEVVSNLADSIKLSFEAAEIPASLKDEVQYRFRITRHSGAEEVVVRSETEPTILEGDKYVFEDTTAEPNKLYYYSIISYYLFSDSNVLYSQSESTPTDSNDAHILPSPYDVTAAIKSVSEDKLNYDISLEWKVPYTDPTGDGIAFDVSRKDTSDISAEPENADITGITVTADGNNNFTVTAQTQIELTEDEAKFPHYYVYTVKMSLAGASSQVIDGSTSKNTVETIPTINVASLFSDFKTSEQKLAGKVTLSWTDNSNQEALNDGRVTYTLSRTTDSSLSDLEKVEDFSSDVYAYTDTNVEDGQTYYYLLQATFKANNSGNPADGFYTQKTVSASTLEAVTTMNATDGESTEECLITWQDTGAEKYVVQYRVHVSDSTSTGFVDVPSEDGSYISQDENGVHTFRFVKDAGKQSAGIVYDFRVLAVDDGGNRTNSGNIDSGSILGPASIHVTLIPYTESIEVKWNEIDGAARYTVNIYAEGSSKPFKSERIQPGVGTYTLFASDPDIDAIGDHPLSQSFSFEIVPVVEGQETAPTDKYTASWVRPPKNIIASKGSYKDMVKLSWEGMSDVSGYRIYRRTPGSSQWTSVRYVTSDKTSTEFPFFSSDSVTEYEYTIASYSALGEGPKQTYFIKDSEFTDIDANIGAPLSRPENISVSQMANTSSEMTDDTLQISFSENKYADGYEVTINGYDEIYHFSKKSFGGSSSKVENGIVTLSVPRPKILDSSTLNGAITSYKTVNDKDTISFSHEFKEIPDTYYPVDVVNLVNSFLADIIASADSAFDGDWWPAANNKYEHVSSWYKVTSLTGIATGKTRGLIEIIRDVTLDSGITVYNGSSIGISTNANYAVDSDSTAHFITVGPSWSSENKVQNKISIQLPFAKGKASVSVHLGNESDIDNDSNKVFFSTKAGSFDVTITTNGITITTANVPYANVDVPLR